MADKREDRENREDRMDRIHAVKSGSGPDAGAGAEDAALAGYQEPWMAGLVADRDDGAWEIRDAAGWVVVDFSGSEVLTEDERGLARRIAACVNVCRGVPTEAMESFCSLGEARDARGSCCGSATRRWSWTRRVASRGPLGQVQARRVANRRAG